MKQFIYQVEGLEFSDTEAFGKAWKEAKATAARLHVPVYRLVVDGEKVREEVYYSAGFFNSTKYANKDNICIF